MMTGKIINLITEASFARANPISYPFAVLKNVTFFNSKCADASSLSFGDDNASKYLLW